MLQVASITTLQQPKPQASSANWNPSGTMGRYFSRLLLSDSQKPKDMGLLVVVDRAKKQGPHDPNHS